MDLSLFPPAGLLAAVERGPDGPVSRALLAASHGLSPLLCREAAHLACRGKDPAVSALTEEDKQRLAFYLGPYPGRRPHGGRAQALYPL